MLKILQARLQQYVNHELPGVQAGFRKGRGTRDQAANICWIIEKARESRKTFTSSLLTMPKPQTCISQQTVENSERDGNTRPPYLPPEKLVCRSRNWTLNNGVSQNLERSKTCCILSLCLYNLYAEHMIQNARVDESQPAFKCLGEISIIDMQMTRLYQQKVKRN